MVQSIAPPGTWGSTTRQWTFPADRDTQLLGFDVAWPPPYFATIPDPPIGSVERVFFGGFFYINQEYLVNFPTEVIGPLRSITRAVLRFHIENLAYPDNMVLAVDVRPWAVPTGAEAYSGGEDQPGNELLIPLVSLAGKVGQRVELPLARTADIQRQQSTGFRFTLRPGVPSIGPSNIIQLRTLASLTPPELVVLTVDRIHAHEVILGVT